MSGNPRKAAIYARISVEDENVPKVDHQVAACRALAADHGYEVVEVFADNGIPATGRSIRDATRDKRPGFDALLKLAESGEIDAIIAVAGDRLARNYPDGLDVIEACEQGGAVLLIDDDGLLDPRTPAGEERAMSLFTGGRREIRARSAKQRRRYEAEVAQGRPLWGRRPFGFAWVDEVNERTGKVSRRAMALDEREAEAIRWAVEFFPSPEGSLGGIIREWNRRGLRPTSTSYKRRKAVTAGVPFTGEWSIAGVRGILRNPRIAGFAVRGGEIALDAEGEPIKAVHPAIVSREAQQKVIDKLNDVTRHTSPGPKPRSLGSGVVLCVCGLPLRATTIKGKPRKENGEIDRDAEPVKLPGLRCDVSRNGYKGKLGVPCHVSMRDDVIDPLIADAIAAAFVFGPADLIPRGEVDLSPIEAELSDLHRQENDAADVALLGGVAGGKAIARIQEIHARRGELEAARADAVSKSAQAAMVVDLRADLWGGGRVSLENVSEARSALRERFEGLPLAQRRELVRALLDVRVLPGQGVKLRPERRVLIVHRVVTELNDPEVVEASREIAERAEKMLAEATRAATAGEAA